MPVMRTNGWRALRLVVACMLAAAAAQGTPDYSTSSASVSIPFVPQAPLLSAPPQMMIKAALQTTPPQSLGNPVAAIMDTGSTGLLLSPDQVPGYQTAGGTRGYQFYSSSKLLSVGIWVPVTVTFYDTNGSTELATASVPALVVEQSGTCPGYTLTSDGICPCTAGTNTCPCKSDPNSANCPCPAGNVCPLPPAPGKNIAYMGVGFGQEADYMPQGTPDKNALLNLATIAGKPIAAGTINPGYIIGTTGVTAGLTPANTSGFSFIKLSSYPQYQGDWMPASMCVQINGSTCFPGTVLVDAGVSQSYITVPEKFPTMTNPNGSQLPAVLATGTTVVLKLPAPSPEQPNPVVDSFTVGQGSTLCQPPVVIPDWSGQTFVNTGRTFLQKYQFLYDAKNGYVGLKPQTGNCGG